MGKNVINTLYTIPKVTPKSVMIGYKDENDRFNCLAELYNTANKLSELHFRMLYRRTAVRLAGNTGLRIRVICGAELIGECLNPYENADSGDDNDDDNNTATSS